MCSSAPSGNSEAKLNTSTARGTIHHKKHNKGLSKMNKLINLIRDEEGASMPEYALLVALIAVVVIAGATLLGGNISAKMSATANQIGTTAP